MFEEVTCQDEDGNQYFEGATWSVGSCMHCACISSIMQCSREVSLVTSLENEPTGAVTFTKGAISRNAMLRNIWKKMQAFVTVSFRLPS